LHISTVWRKNPLVKPCLKWAGGKRQLLQEIKKYVPANLDGVRYYEPFVGAGALFFDLQPAHAIINDNNGQLILTYKVIRDDIDALIAALNAHKTNNNEKYYYEVREQDRDSGVFAGFSDVHKAARLIYLNKTCYNGLHRVNSRGLFNVPWGRYANPSIMNEPVLRAIHEYLTHESVNVKIMCGDFEAAVESAAEGSFIYFDPPYHSPGNVSFSGYQAQGFDESEQRRLRDVFVECTHMGAKCLLSNSDTLFIRELYNDDHFDIISVKAKRAINSDSAGRGEVNEVMIKNWK
jgi:DNA adenine methylase